MSAQSERSQTSHPRKKTHRRQWGVRAGARQTVGGDGGEIESLSEETSGFKKEVEIDSS